LKEQLGMLGNPGCCLSRGYFRISERIKDADGDYFIVCYFYNREISQAWYTLDNGDKTFLHVLDKCLNLPWNEVVLAYKTPTVQVFP
jgi:hypothetical protein